MRAGWLLVGLVLAASAGSARAGQEPQAEPQSGPQAELQAEPQAEPQSGPQAELRADLVELVGGLVRGEGQVQARFGQDPGKQGAGPQDTATAARFELDRTRGVLVLWDGTWTRAAGTVRFARAELDLEAGSGDVVEAVFEGAGFEGADGRLSLAGEALSWSPDGTLSGRGLRLTTCGCEEPPWEVQARQVTVDERAAAFRGGLLRLCGLPVLPLPAGRVALAERSSGLLPPEVGWGRDGLELGLPLYLVAGEGADLTLTPELRTARGARLLGEGRWAHPGGRGELRLAGGWDGVEGAARGAGQLDQAWADQGARVAVLGRVEGDLGAVAGRQVGVLRLEGTVQTRLRAWSDGDPWAEAGGVGTAWLPGWTDLGGGRLLGEVGLRAGTAALLGEVDARLVEDLAAPAWQVGPVARGRLLTAAGVPVSAGGMLALRPDGLVPTAWLRATRGPWGLTGTVDGGLQDLGLAYDDGAAGLRFQVQHVDELVQVRPEASLRLPGRLSQWRPGYAAHLDLDQGLPLSHGPSLAFSSRCGCLDAGLVATWSVDREVPAVGFRLEVR